MQLERTLILVKPDGVQRGLVHNVMKRFERRGFQLVALTLVDASPRLVEAHYAHLRTRDFFPRLLGYMTSAPTCAMVWQGVGVVAAGRSMLGATFPPDWRPGTIRGDLCQTVEFCVAHASDSNEAAEREVALWFPSGVLQYTQPMSAWLVA